MIRLPPRSTRTDTLFPYTTLFRSASDPVRAAGGDRRLLHGNPCRRSPWRKPSLLHTDLRSYPAAEPNGLPQHGSLCVHALPRDGSLVGPFKPTRTDLRKARSEGHTSELRSLMGNTNAVFGLK